MGISGSLSAIKDILFRNTCEGKSLFGQHQQPLDLQLINLLTFTKSIKQ